MKRQKTIFENVFDEDVVRKVSQKKTITEANGHMSNLEKKQRF